jgi:hypothetical protein
MRTRSYFSIYLLTYLYSFRFWLINYFYWIIPSEFVLHHRCFLLINKVEKNKYNYFLFIKSSSWKKEKVNNDMNWRTRRSMCVCIHHEKIMQWRTILCLTQYCSYNVVLASSSSFFHYINVCLRVCSLFFLIALSQQSYPSWNNFI